MRTIGYRAHKDVLLQRAAIMSEGKNGLSYAQAGVDIDAGNALVEAIKPAAKATARAGVMSGLGGFGALFDLKAAGYSDPVLVAATDGVGTKLRIAIDTGHLDTIGIDLVAMCVNDLVCQGAEPLFFLDYFATGKLDVADATRIITGIAAGCQKSGCALIGARPPRCRACMTPRISIWPVLQWVPWNAAAHCPQALTRAMCCWGWHPTGCIPMATALCARWWIMPV